VPANLLRRYHRPKYFVEDGDVALLKMGEKFEVIATNYLRP